jgi:hypothetical protein
MGFPFISDDSESPRAFAGGVRTLLVVLAALTLSACSGGASTHENEPPPPSSNPDPPANPDPPTDPDPDPPTDPDPPANPDPDPPTDPEPPVDPNPPPPATTAMVMWTPPVTNVDGSPLVDLAGYRIYYGRSRDNLATTIEIPNPGLTTYAVEDLSAGTWYFALTAYSAQDAESARSPVTSKTID